MNNAYAFLFSKDEGDDGGNGEDRAGNDQALVPVAVPCGPDHGGNHGQGDGDGVSGQYIQGFFLL